MRALASRVSDVTRVLGWRALWVLPSWAVRRNFSVLVKDLRNVPPRPVDAEIRCTLLGEADLSRAVEIEPTMTETEIRKRWDEGQECLIGWIGGVPAGLHWDSMRSTYLPFLGRTLRLAEGDTYAGHGYTRPHFRGRGVHPHLSSTAMHRARDRGARRSIALVAAWNRPAHHINLEKLGRSIAGSVGYWNLVWTRRYTAIGDVRLDDSGGFSILD